MCDFWSRMRRVVGGVPLEKSLVFWCTFRSPPFIFLVVINQIRLSPCTAHIHAMPTKWANVARFNAIHTRDGLHVRAISILRWSRGPIYSLSPSLCLFLCAAVSHRGFGGVQFARFIRDVCFIYCIFILFFHLTTANTRSDFCRRLM